MSVSYREGDIFTEQDLDGIAHQTNTRGVFGSGIARAIRELYPKAYKKSQETCASHEGDKILGTFDIVKIGPKGFYILNVYSQVGIGGEGRNTRYDILADVLVEIRDRLEGHPSTFKLGVPYGFGSGLAGGSWTIVEAIFKSVFESSKTIELIIVKNPKFADSVTK